MEEESTQWLKHFEEKVLYLNERPTNPSVQTFMVLLRGAFYKLKRTHPWPDPHSLPTNVGRLLLCIRATEEFADIVYYLNSLHKLAETDADARVCYSQIQGLLDDSLRAAEEKYLCTPYNAEKEAFSWKDEVTEADVFTTTACAVSEFLALQSVCVRRYGIEATRSAIADLVDKICVSNPK